jgi:hypothetical protein
MNTAIGLISLGLGTVLILMGILLTIVELITGDHAGGGPTAERMAGYNWKGMAAFVNAVKALCEVIGKWPKLLWFFLPGLILFLVGVGILVTRPIHG